ncbi:MAG: adenylate/guanylate cyclase domain-containing protein, partial [Candidatus Tectomicrobia bacterium]|nr:adenylate/guanylate cyclase domain-containing protein [Candidatus Tectomicrobia bacterium]
LDATVGYSSAACGADILFAEAMLQRHKELHIVLPFQQEDFCRTSVDFCLPAMAGWRTRFAAVLAQAEVHYATTQPFLGDDILFTFVNTFTQGLAITRAAHLGVDPYALVVRDPSAAERLGGTAYFLRRWQAGKRRVAPEIDLAALRAQLGSHLTTWSNTVASPAPAPVGRLTREIKAMLFGDVRHFSHLGDEQIPDFLCHVFDHVADIIAQTQPPPAFCNTWGDGLVLVFHTVQECADFAMRLLEWIETVRWTDIGFPEDTIMRLGLHAGPVYAYHDRILDRQNFFGNHVNQAARIEPVTTPGCAYASEQFAALLAVECDDAFVCDYVGVEKLAKDFGHCPLYRVRRRG